MSRLFPQRGRVLRYTELAVAALAVLFLVANASAQMDLLYINANIGACPTCQVNANQILAYNLNVNTGKLTRILGPFTTGGSGVYNNPPGIEVNADKQVIINQEGTLLFAVDGGSNDVAVFIINSDGTLTPVPGSPFYSNGPQPASLGLLQDPNIGGGNSILVVANKDNDPLQPPTSPNYSTFTASPSGTLTLNTLGTKVLPQGASPSQVLINGNGDIMVGAQYLGTNNHAQLTSYRISANGRLTSITTLNPPNNGKNFLGEVMHPVTSALYTGLPDQNNIGVFQLGIATGSLSFNKAVADLSKSGWMTINKNGTRLYVTENSSNSLTVYKTANSLSPVQLQHLTLSSGGSYGPTSLALDPTEKYLFVLTGTTLHTLSVQSDGTLAEILGAHLLPLPAGTIPTGMATTLK